MAGSDGEDDEDKALWDHVTRNVKPLDKSDIAPFAAPVILRKNNGHEEFPRKKTAEKQHKIEKEPVHYRESSREVDKRTARRSQRGKLQIDGRIDLHGMTGKQAHDALLEYLPRCYEGGKRQILVITGKGIHSSAPDNERGWWEGAHVLLREAVPHWLNEPPLSRIVLRHSPAQGRDGGLGALYVFLRRKRD